MALFPRRLGLVVFVSLISACVRGSWGGEATAPSDLGAGEPQLYLDTGPHPETDRGVHDWAPADAGHDITMDAAPRDQPWPDGPPACVEDQGITLAQVCAQQSSAPPAEDPDQDGLSGVQDPWPSVCNELEVLEGFTDEGLPAWTASYGAQSSYAGDPCGARDGTGACVVGGAASVNCFSGDSCSATDTCRCSGLGPAQWSCASVTPSGTALSLTALPATITDGSYLTEVKLTLGAISDPTNWSVGFRAADDPAGPQYRECTIWVRWVPGTYFQENPGIHLVAQTSTTGGGGVSTGQTWTAQTNLPAAAGQQYILQSWADETYQRCRLLSPDGATLIAGPISLGSATPLPGSIELLARGREATFDYVRVFSQ